MRIHIRLSFANLNSILSHLHRFLCFESLSAARSEFKGTLYTSSLYIPGFELTNGLQLYMMHELLSDLQENVAGLWAPRAVQRIRNPSPEDFFRRYIATNTPVIIEGALSSWADTAQWTPEALVHRAGELTVTVDVTPDGYGDCVKSNLFVKPEERRMLFKDFIANLQDDRQVG